MKCKENWILVTQWTCLVSLGQLPFNQTVTYQAIKMFTYNETFITFAHPIKRFYGKEF